MGAGVILLGAGSSGWAAARLLHAHGRGRGWVVAEKPPPDVETFRALGFAFRAELPEESASLAVISPGFPVEHPWMRRLVERGIPRVPEFALGATHLRGSVVAITGSLGKTSMTLLAAEVLRSTGRSVTVSGNIGTPVCEVALRSPGADVHVIELSSFQLEINEEFRPDAALCLNLFPNHLDRHGTLERYAAAKARLFAFQTAADVACWPDPYPVPVPCRARRVFPREDTLPPLDNTPFSAGPLRRNLAALWAVLEPFGSFPQAASVIRKFRFPAFRMQEVAIPGAGRVINDSKSTCLSATLAALETLPGHVHLIVGGLPKNEDLEGPGRVFARRGVSLYLMGASGEAMRNAWAGLVPYCENHRTLPACLEAVWMRRKRGESLLFSPGCASFDQYSGYAERGNHFQRLVEALAAQKPLDD